MKATFIGTSAIIMWSMLALFTSFTQGIPPFQLLTLTFALGGTVGVLYIFLIKKSGLKSIKQPLKAWLIGVSGLFGYHFLYFNALSRAPVAEASLIAYLWPLLIVLFSAFLPNEKLKWFHILGALIGLSGAFLIIQSKGNLTFDSAHNIGYLFALGCALTWSIYSVLNRTQASVPRETVAFFCLITAVLAFLSHTLFENWYTPNFKQWLAIIGLGIGPVGLSFYTWDYGTKNGDIRLLGVLSYLAPLLSTFLLIISTDIEMTWHIAIACCLITFGAIIASRDLIFKSKKNSSLKITS